MPSHTGSCSDPGFWSPEISPTLLPQSRLVSQGGCVERQCVIWRQVIVGCKEINSPETFPARVNKVTTVSLTRWLSASHVVPRHRDPEMRDSQKQAQPLAFTGTETFHHPPPVNKVSPRSPPHLLWRHCSGIPRRRREAVTLSE